MKKVKYTLMFLLGLMILLTDCGPDYDWIICNSCAASSPWSVWSLDLSNPCFNTKSECEEWGRSHLPGDQWKCQICDK